MAIDDLQRAWQSNDPPERISIDPEILLREVKRNSQSFSAAIFWRDFREVGVAVIMVGVCGYLAATEPLWPMWIVAGSMLWVGSFMTVDRLVQKRRQAGPSQPLLAAVEQSLAEVEHQIWLLRNVFWWYLLPPAAAIGFVYGYVAWQIRSAGWLFIVKTEAPIVIGTILVFWLVYWVNRRAVRTQLAPRQAEIKELLEAMRNPPPQ